jgi:hypothetical protein
VSLKRVGSSSELSLRVSGPLCGQEGNPSHAEAIACDRPLIWNSVVQRMDFAPLSEARAITR